MIQSPMRPGWGEAPALTCDECGRTPAMGCGCPDVVEDLGAEHDGLMDEIADAVHAYGCHNSSAEIFAENARREAAKSDHQRNLAQAALDGLSADAQQLLAEAEVVNLNGKLYRVDHVDGALSLRRVHPLVLGS